MNKIRLCVFSAIIIIFITSCGPGTTDWSYELPNGYRISRYNSKEVFVAGGRACTSDPKYIKCSVTDFAYDDRYVFTKHYLNDDEMYYYILDTEKELLYVEDALGHEQHFQSEWQNTTQRLQDEDLKRFTHEQQQKHRQIFQSFYDLL